MEAYYVFKDLAIIIIFAKFFGILARKLKAPQVVGTLRYGNPIKLSAALKSIRKSE